jgi:translation elongation factor EF-1beta
MVKPALCCTRDFVNRMNERKLNAIINSNVGFGLLALHFMFVMVSLEDFYART